MLRGDVAALVSPTLTMPNDGCLTFAYNLSPDETLDVGYRKTPHSFVTYPLCTTLGDRRQAHDWYSSNVPIPAGEYHLVFQATVIERTQAKIYINNITVSEFNCTEEIGEYGGDS